MLVLERVLLGHDFIVFACHLEFLFVFIHDVLLALVFGFFVLSIHTAYVLAFALAQTAVGGFFVTLHFLLIAKVLFLVQGYFLLTDLHKLRVFCNFLLLFGRSKIRGSNFLRTRVHFLVPPALFFVLGTPILRRHLAVTF